MVTSSGLHHLGRRKRIYLKFEEYPHQNKAIRFFDNFLIFVAILGPSLALPQVLKIYSEKSVQNISFFSWSSWFVLGIFWLFYGIIHKDKPLIIAYILWTLMHFLIVLAFFIFN